jgi:hypothetical protein
MSSVDAERVILKSTWIEEGPSTAIALSTEQGCLDSA